MSDSRQADHREPTRWDSVVFFGKTRLLILARAWRERGRAVKVHSRGQALGDAAVITEVKAPLWTQVSGAEFPLTAGKVQNLRAACLPLHGLEIPAGEVFSFWKQLGRTTRQKGYVQGRELRSGCLVPNLGGGLCQLSGLLHAAALAAGMVVVERHEHSRMLPGSVLPPERDATVFWNYVDLRFRADFDWRLELELTATDLVVRIRAVLGAFTPVKVVKSLPGVPVRAAADGDCLTCNVNSCFRHPSAIRDHAPAVGHSAYLLEGVWPEFQDWCERHAHAGDRWFAPLDGRRWKKPNYAWVAPAGVSMHHQTFMTLRRAWRQRSLPSQGAQRQRFLLDSQRQLAEEFARKINPQARHLVVSQSLLPHLWLAGHLGGRTFDVLLQRWPMAEIHKRLDQAALLHSRSDTLADFRADAALVRAENEALAAAARVVTPHRAVADYFGTKAILLPWTIPSVKRITTPKNGKFRWFFPASALGRKGIYELAEVFGDSDRELWILGKARDGVADLLQGVTHRPASVGDLAECSALVIPAWIEHEPRLALRALTMGLPVIASKACGLAAHPLLREIEVGDVAGLREAVTAVEQGQE